MKVAHIATSDQALVYLLLNQLERFREAGYTVAGIASAGDCAARLAAAGVAFHAVPLTRRMSPLSDLRALVRLYRILRRERFDMIHTHTPKGGLFGQLAALVARVPIRVHTIHGLYLPGSMRPDQRWRYIWLERLTMAFCHHVFSQNPEDVDVAVREHIVAADRIELLGNGIVLSRFDPATTGRAERRALRAELDLTDEHLVVGMVARLVAEKGYPEAFEAARLVAARIPQARFVFIGGFEDKADAIAPDALARAKIADVAQFLGHREDVERLYGIMDVFMLPSHREGFPRSVMEASAMGLPCVVTDVRGCRQTVSHRQTGLIVPVRDSAALADALVELLESPNERARMGAGARAKALAEFDEARVIEILLAAYRRLAER